MPVPERPVLVAPDSFKGTFSAPQVAGAIADGSRAAAAINDDLIAEEHGIEPMLPRRTAVPSARAARSPAEQAAR